MNNNCQLKLVISYCHIDENQITEFRKFLAPFKNNNTLEDWYDRKIFAGDDFQKDIDQNFENADLICLCLSQNFLKYSRYSKKFCEKIAKNMPKSVIKKIYDGF